MKTIFKYPLELAREQYVPMHGKPVLFKVGLDPAGALCVWALVNPEDETKLQKFFVVGTGHDVPVDAYFWVGTVNQGQFMWHIFTP